MANRVRRGRAMLTDSPTARFLHAMIKQLDLKSIDWNDVASQMEISNGHAARMRYSRFRQQMEGTMSTTRSSRSKKNTSSRGKKGKTNAGLKKDLESTEPLAMISNIKQESGVTIKQEAGCTSSHLQQSLMPEDGSGLYSPNIPSLADIPLAPQSMMHTQHASPMVKMCPPASMASAGLLAEAFRSTLTSSLRSEVENQNSPHAWNVASIDRSGPSRPEGALIKTEALQSE